ncbi:alpha/beta hydrolase [Amycolatopsis minnesotensis]|uniref:Alpha/beta hydrolase n=1 Tax=Amycolatopsis minnesotensis TaxID=337894 RepID=A0ABP5CM79_9PSEU
MHVAEIGDPHAPACLFLHGWPESWRAWLDVLGLASARFRAVAMDLPGIGGSTGRGGRKRELAATVRELVAAMGLTDVTLVGHDAGGMVAYACLRRCPGLARVVVLNTVVPGVAPWETVLGNPRIWHFGLHAVPSLPETLVRGREAAYFDYFYDILSADPARITPEARAAHVDAYRAEGALTAGFDLYRAFGHDTEDNTDVSRVDIPLLYLRGDHEYGDIAAYAAGFRAAGIANVTTGEVPGAGHFAPEEAPEAVWHLIDEFSRET